MKDTSGSTRHNKAEISPLLRPVRRIGTQTRGGAQIEVGACLIDRLQQRESGAAARRPLRSPGRPGESSSHPHARGRELRRRSRKRYSDFAQRGGEQVAIRIDIETNDDPNKKETFRLNRFEIGPARPFKSYAMPAVEPKDRSLPTGRVAVPFRLLNNHVIVDARVNGRGPFPFLVDTGGHDIITPSTASALGLREQGELEATGAGEHVAMSGYAAVESLQVGNALLSHQTVTELDFSPVDVEGLALGGMIGVEFFERFVVEIDYSARTLTLIDPAHFSASDRGHAGNPTPFKFYSHMPEVDGDLDGRKGLFNIDTGSRTELTLTSPFVDEYSVRQAYPHGITITDGWGVGGPSTCYVGSGGKIRSW
jgi:hypothetical protein